jgi:hypothetical protein
MRETSKGNLLGFFCSIGKYILLYSDKAKYTFPPFVSEEKLARRVPTVAFSVWSVWPGGRERPAIVSLFEVPGCFAGPTEEPQSGRLSSLWKKDERQRPRVFFIEYATFQNCRLIFL